MELAVLDLGSTTFHLQHFVVGADGQLASCLDVKKSLGLGAQVFADGFVSPQSHAVAMAAVGELLEISDTRGFTQRVVVATSAIRTARNGRALAAHIAAQFQCDVRILEPQEEATLAYVGQLDGAGLGNRRFAMVDLGGGSVELSVGQHEKPQYAASLPLGAVRMRALAGAQRGQDGPELAALRDMARDLLREPLRTLESFGPELYVFGSGSARAARRLLCRRSEQPGKTGPIETAEFRAQLAALEGLSPLELVELGVEPARAETVLVAAAIMLEILELSGVQRAVVSGRGLRDGVARELFLALSRRSAVVPRGARLPPSNSDAPSAAR